MPQAKKTLTELSNTYDRNVVIPARIAAAIAALEKSGDEWATEEELLALGKPKLSTKDLALFRDQFADFWATVRDIGKNGNERRIWFATKKLASKWKELNSG